MSNIGKIVADTKFRRETSNFKIVFGYDVDASSYVYIPDPNSEDPSQVIEGLLQILPKNLGGEDFIGMIVGAGSNMMSTIVETGTDLSYGQMVLTATNGMMFYYWPETGYFTDNTYDPTDADHEEP